MASERGDGRAPRRAHGGSLRAVPHRRPRREGLDDPPNGRGAGGLRAVPEADRADARHRRDAAEDETTAGPTSSSGTAFVPSSTSTAGACASRSRNDKDLLTSFPELRAARAPSSARRAQSSTARSSRSTRRVDRTSGRLQRRLHVVSPSAAAKKARESPVSFLAFDVLYLLGRVDDRAHLRRATPPARRPRARGRHLRLAAVLRRRARQQSCWPSRSSAGPRGRGREAAGLAATRPGSAPASGSR